MPRLVDRITNWIQRLRLEVIRDKCGHLDSTTTMRFYLHSDEDGLRGATGDVGDILFGGDD